MSPTDTLRAAATRLREAANAATPGPYGVETMPETGESRIGSQIAQRWVVGGRTIEPDATYIALMQPAVALAVADWLDAESALDHCCEECPPQAQAFAVAHAVLGGDA